MPPWSKLWAADAPKLGEYYIAISYYPTASSDNFNVWAAVAPVGGAGWPDRAEMKLKVAKKLSKKEKNEKILLLKENKYHSFFNFFSNSSIRFSKFLIFLLSGFSSS